NGFGHALRGAEEELAGVAGGWGAWKLFLMAPNGWSWVKRSPRPRPGQGCSMLRPPMPGVMSGGWSASTERVREARPEGCASERGKRQHDFAMAAFSFLQDVARLLHAIMLAKRIWRRAVCSGRSVQSR